MGALTPEQQLDAITTSMAGKPATAECVFDAEAWDKQVQETTFGQRRGSSVGGYAFPGSTVVYLGPQACYALYDVFSGGYIYAGLNPTAYGLLTLLHEAVHLRGVVNEGETDCTALRAFQSYLDDIGVPATVVKPVKVGTRYVPRRVPNVYVGLLVKFAQRIHDRRPLEYRGNC
jgi:hypothetical protein